MSQLRFTDEVLMAFADGELDREMAAAVAEAARHDPQVAARIAMFNASTQILQKVFDPMLDEPLPPHLVRAVERLGEPDGPRHRRLGGRRESRIGRLAAIFTRPWPVAAAASLAGLLIGAIVPWPFQAPPSAPAIAALSIRVPDEVLAVLERVPSGAAERVSVLGRAVDILPVASYRRSASFCRAFDVSDSTARTSSPLHAIACREEGLWRVAALADGTAKQPDPDSFVPAGADQDLAAALGLGNPLSTSEEATFLGCGNPARGDREAMKGRCSRE